MNKIGFSSSQAEQIVADAVKDNPMIESLRKKRGIGIYVDKLLFASSDYLRQESMNVKVGESGFSTSGLLSHLGNAVINDTPPEYQESFRERMGEIEKHVARDESASR